MSGLNDIEIGEEISFSPSISMFANYEYLGIKIYQEDDLCLIEYGMAERGIGNRLARDPHSKQWLCIGKEMDGKKFFAMDCYSMNHYEFKGESIKAIFAMAKQIWNDDSEVRTVIMKLT